MKTTNTTIIILVITSLFVSCTKDIDNWYNSYDDIYGNNSSNTPGNMGGSTGNLSDFNVAIDSTSLAEDETIPSDDKDYVENFKTTKNIEIKYSNSSVSVNGDVAGVSIQTNGADVTVTSTTEKVNYILSGSTTDGSFKMAESEDNKKFKLTLDGVSINNNDGPAINIQVGKRCYVVANNGTYNSFSDGTAYAESEEDQKGTFFSEGELLFSGKGHIKVNANAKAGIVSDDYIMIRPNTNIYVKATAGNGIKANDGIDVRGGVVNVEATANAAKGIKSDGYYTQSGGRVIAIVTGKAEYDSEERDYKGAKGLKADSLLTIDGGKLIIVSSGGSECEGIESKSKLVINDGEVQSFAYDDAINSSDNMSINGGSVFAYSIGNDGIDANGNLYIKGGLVYAIGSSNPELAIDANTEGGKKLYVTGGTIIAIGGLEGGESLSQSCYATSTWSKSKWYALKYGDKTLAFQTPSGGGSTLVVSAASSPTLLSDVTVSSGNKIFSSAVYTDATISGGSNVSLSSYSGSSMGSGGFPGGGGWGF